MNIRRPAFWAKIALINAVASVIATYLSGDSLTRGSLGVFILNAAITFLVSSCCSSLCILAMPQLMRIVSRRFVFPVNWALAVAALILLAAIGSFTAFTILAVIGYINPDRFVEIWFNQALKVSIVTTLVFGIFFTAVGVMRAEIEEKTLALRTKERDEADARRLAAQAQLASLEARVQPHFLFNTLNSIAALIPDNPEGAERMTGQLAALMRASLHADPTALVPLHEELDLVSAYLGIERVRFGDRLRYSVDVPAALRDVNVPRQSLQTLVENSVKYAVTPRREGGVISIRATQSGDRVCLQVDDDGPGFQATTFPSHHGLALLNERLGMIFGGQSSLSVVPGGGASVVIEIPAS